MPEQKYIYTDPGTSRRYTVRYEGEVRPSDDVIRQSLGLGKINKKLYRNPDTGEYVVARYHGDTPPTGEEVFAKHKAENTGAADALKGAIDFLGQALGGAGGGGYRAPEPAIPRPAPVPVAPAGASPDALNYVLYPAAKPITDAATTVGNSSRNFAQGVTASRMRRRSGDTPSESVVRNALSLMAPGNPVEEFQDTVEGLKAVWKNNGDKQIGKEVPELAPDTLGGMAYNTLTALGSDPLNFVGGAAPAGAEAFEKLLARSGTLRKAVAAAAAVSEAAKIARQPVGAARVAEAASVLPDAVAAQEGLATAEPALALAKSPATKTDDLLFKIGDEFNGGVIESMDTGAGTVNVRYPDGQAETIAVRLAGPDANTVADLATLTEQSAGNVDPTGIAPVEPPVSSPPVDASTRPLTPAPVPARPRSAGQTSFKRVTPEPVIPQTAVPPVPMLPESNPGYITTPSGSRVRVPSVVRDATQTSQVPSRVTSRVPAAIKAVGEKSLAAFDTVDGTMRQLSYGSDLSAPLRQGLILSAGNSRTAGRAMVAQVKAAASEEEFARQMQQIGSRPNASVYRSSGLYVPAALESGGATAPLLQTEEAFAKGIAHKIPGVGKVIQGSDRAMTSYLTHLRADVYDDMAGQLAKAGITPKSDPQAYKALADYINVTTGRGSLESLEPHAQALSRVFASPRFQASRVQVFDPRTYTRLPKVLRVAALKNLGAAIGANASLIALAHVIGEANPGGKVGATIDPRATDFGAVRVGKSRVDMTSGMSAWAKFLTQVGTGQKVTGSGREKTVAPLETAGHFTEGRMGPLASLALEAVRGTNYGGQPIVWTDELKARVVPLLIQDAIDATKANGPLIGGAVTVPAALGAGVQTYDSRKGNRGSVRRTERP